jgi:GxxExxY protein
MWCGVNPVVRAARRDANLLWIPSLGCGVVLAGHSSNVVSDRVIAAAIEVHRHLGPGLLESAYRQCLCLELEAHGIPHEVEVAVPVVYRGHQITPAYRIDLLVERTLVVELKAVQEILDIHRAQVLTYLKLSEYPAGLIINFHVNLLKNGLRRILL